MTKIAIVGSRDYPNLRLAEKILTKNIHAGDVVISGGARGIDSLAEKIAQSRGLKMIVFPADWETHGKSAGFLRNTQIVEEAEVIIAMWDGKSRGTLDTLKKAKKAGKTYYIFGPNGEQLR